MMANTIENMNNFFREHEPQHSCTAQHCQLTKKRRIDMDFDEIHYRPFQPSGKLLGVWSSNSRLSNSGKYNLFHLGRDHLLILSMFHCFIEYDNELDVLS